MAKQEETVKQLGRILYVEPNDFSGDINGNPVTPDYTDYTIYCNLLVERTSRLKNGYVGDDVSRKYSIEADLSQEGGYVSFFQGTADDYQYYTTDYTDIHFNTVQKRQFVEGLQITGIDITYQNRMAPMVVMQMVDVRGAGLFAREEAIHVNGGLDNMPKNKDGMIIDNIYSSFMTFPYPKYKLLIKGYYGRMVTYQLSCQNFTGKLDGNTGNFNITATFIGYEYGFLQDLPLSYIIAAPHTKTGRAYWNSMVNNEEWNLFGPTTDQTKPKPTEPPVFLTDFYKDINAATIKDDNGSSSLEKVSNISPAEIKSNIGSKSGELDNIKTAISDLITEIKNGNIGLETVMVPDIENPKIASNFDNDLVVVLYSNHSTVSLKKEVSEKYQRLSKLLYNYSYNNPEDGVGQNMLPNFTADVETTDNMWNTQSGTLSEYVRKSGDRLLILRQNGNSSETDALTIKSSGDEFALNNSKYGMKRLFAGDIYSFNSKQSKIIYDKYITAKNTSSDKYDYPYASVIVFRNYLKLTKILTDLEDQLEEYNQQIQDATLLDVKNVTHGVTPYIGNYFRMVFCHVETFIHTLKVCADNIYSEMTEGKRDPAKLGIVDFRNSTDVPYDLLKPMANGTKAGIPPFPGIYVNSDGNVNDGLDSNMTKNISWVGNIKGEQPWCEAELINDYYNAMRQIMPQTNEIPWSETDDIEYNFNLLPFMLNTDMASDLFTTRDGLAYYISILTSYILGIGNKNVEKMTAEEAGMTGAILASHLFNNIEDKSLLNGRIEGDDINTELYNIATITDQKSAERNLFEFSKGINGRHPILKKDDNKLQYVYMKTTKTDMPLIPLNTISEWNKMQTLYKYHNTAGGDYVAYEPIEIIDGEYVTLDREVKLSEEEGSGTKVSFVTGDDYVNNHMFSIMLDACNVNEMLMDVSEYKSSGKDIGNYKRADIVSKIVNKYWLLDDNFDKYQSVKPEKLTTHGVEIPDFNQDEVTFGENDLKKIMNVEF